ncbi:thymus-specific serine protease isoform X1 [Neoarius graeffei]|uniref:thymus-specific serine protease isoform X1 n=1 Tax=Neoarius graeffei TaxID=443677 RepID=UPI00298C22B5|nr:thymus-specific serine protease isoform X1 [Neoarius graeffei]
MESTPELLILFKTIGRVLWMLKKHVHSVQEQKAEQHLLRMDKSHLVEGQLHQKLDHFNGRITDTLPQKFIVNEAYWKKPDGPVFLYISGEGPLCKFSVLAGHHVTMAEKHRALLVALEHRFYGSSINPGGLELLNLQHLSSQQALADLAAFHNFISQKYALTDKNIWICFGGSYAGALSAWFRGKFPHLVYGAVASSAPVQAKLDFSAYNKVVGHSLTEESVGGSYKCLNSVRKAFVALEAALLGGKEMKVVKDFGCCDVPKSPEDRTELVQSVADIFMGSVQYNEEGVMLTIAQICDIMTNQSQEEAYDRLVKLATMYRAMVKEPCLDISHQHTILNLNKSSSGSFGSRQWYYQTCTEFGFYQTCDDASCPFVRTLTLQDHTQLCRQLFEIPEHTLHTNIAFTNQYYGGNQAQTQRVLYINGDIDPWMELSIVHNGTGVDEDRAIVIHGAAHCADMNPTHSRDKPSLRQARKEIERHVVMWLKSAAWENTL